MSDMTNMALVERVAKAIYMRRNGHGCRPWVSVEASHRTPYRDDARAAISTIAEALRGPTENMCVAGTEDWLCIRAMEDRADACWLAMLAASPLYGAKDNE